MEICPICKRTYTLRNPKVQYHLRYGNEGKFISACKSCNYAEYLSRHWKRHLRPWQWYKIYLVRRFARDFYKVNKPKHMEGHQEKEPVFKIELPKVGDELLIGPMHVKAWKESYLNPERGVTEELIDQFIGHLAHDTDYRKNTIIEALANPDKIMYRVVWNDKGEVVGFFHGTKEDTQNVLDGVYLLDEAKGTGVGGKLMREFLNWIDKSKKTYLEVFSTNQKALGYYKKYGFVELEGSEKMYKDKIPYVEMERPADEE